MLHTEEIKIVKYKKGVSDSVSDVVVREEPLEIYINGMKKYFCMRMPGMDYELSLGLLYNEGIINSFADVINTEYGEGRIDFTLKHNAADGVRRIYSSSGSMFSDELIAPSAQRGGEFHLDRLFSLQKDFFKMQNVFDKTGGVHACAFYTSGGELISFAEDVGRHNALDKCMGSAIASGASEDIVLLMLSSRISFEMIRKSYRTGAVIVAGVSAPTSAAVTAADKSGMSLVGFLRNDRFNIYTHPDRIKGI